MLVRFSLRNYKPFKEEVQLSMVASNYDKTTRAEENVFEVPAFGLKLLKSAVIFGANASGKSKLAEGMGFMRNLVIRSSRETQKGDRIDVQPFLLSTETEHAPSEFEIIFLHEGAMYRYGFEVQPQGVVAEWLFLREKTKEVQIFYRQGQEFELHPIRFRAAKPLVDGKMIRPNALFISVAAQFNNKLAGKVLEWFLKFNVISGLQEDGYQGFTMGKAQNDQTRSEILSLLKSADLGIEALTLKPLEMDNIPAGLPRELREIVERKLKAGEVYMDVLTSHKKYDAKKQETGMVQFSINKEESSGTRKFFALSGPVLDTLHHGKVLVGDELESKLHSNLVCKLAELFNSRENNPFNGQLIFNTHDTNLLSSGIFRRDQIWFMEKDRFGAAKLYSLSDFEARKEENYERNYLRGKYGAVPYLAEFRPVYFTKPSPGYEDEK
ncbi:MAG: ATP-binding protein [Haliscomenobacter sp.]|nr:ATP-binding protein [Haliscomenobacter sp.]MBK8878871.1 ATP-binding protein [Haliscomenobacter sp.]